MYMITLHYLMYAYYPIILAANRDKDYARHTTALTFQYTFIERTYEHGTKKFDKIISFQSIDIK